VHLQLHALRTPFPSALTLSLESTLPCDGSRSPDAQPMYLVVLAYAKVSRLFSASHSSRHLSCPFSVYGHSPTVLPILSCPACANFLPRFGAIFLRRVPGIPQPNLVNTTDSILDPYDSFVPRNWQHHAYHAG
jgi:hypothetical protein